MRLINVIGIFARDSRPKMAVHLVKNLWKENYK